MGLLLFIVSQRFFVIVAVEAELFFAIKNSYLEFNTPLIIIIMYLISKILLRFNALKMMVMPDEEKKMKKMKKQDHVESNDDTIAIVEQAPSLTKR